MGKKNNNSEKIKSISAIIASIFIPIAVLFIGNWHSTALKESETQVRYIELAVEILKEEPSAKNINIRNWAVDLINNYSDINLDTLTKNELLNEPLFKEVDEFIDEDWIPLFLENYIGNPAVIPYLIEIFNSGDEEKIKKDLSKMIIAANKAIEQKRNKLKEEIKEGKTTLNNR